MKKNNVHEDRREEREGERNEAVEEEQNPSHELSQEDRTQVVGQVQRAEELRSQAGGRRLRNEVQKPVQAEDREHEPQQEAGDESGDFHGRDISEIND